MHKTFLISLAIFFIAGCSNSPAPSSYPYPGVGGTYDVSEVYTHGADTVLVDTMHSRIDAVNQLYDGRDSVSRLVRTINGHLFDTMYIHYLSSGDIEVETSLQNVPGFLLYPFATQRALTTYHDTILYGELFRDTSSFSGAGSTTLTVAGKSISAQALNYSVKGIDDGAQGASTGTDTYIPALFYFGSLNLTLVSQTPSTRSSVTLIAYNIK